MVRRVCESFTANTQVTNLVIVPAHFAIEPEGVPFAQTRPGGIETALEDVRGRHVRHPASLRRQSARCLGARPETCEDCYGSEYTEKHAQHAMIHGWRIPGCHGRLLGDDHEIKDSVLFQTVVSIINGH